MSGYERIGAKNGRLPLGLLALSYALAEVAILVVVSVVIGSAYYGWVLGDTTAWDLHIHLGAAIAVLIVGASLLTGTYRSENLHEISVHPDRLALTVVFGFPSLVLVLFLTKTSVDYSRVVILLSLVVGFFALLVSRRVAAAGLCRLIRRGKVGLPRVMLVGAKGFVRQIVGEGRAFLETHSLVACSEIATSVGSSAEFDRDLEHVRGLAQRLAPDRVVLFFPWSERKTIESVVGRLGQLPCSVHLDDDPGFRDFIKWANVSGFGPLGVTLVRRPLGDAQILLKRFFDLAGAMAGLVLLSPVLAVVAMAIKLDSSGPVLFRQKRYGFSRQPFDVFKFRTMHADSSKEGFRQATRDDSRVTRIGRFLRKTSLDELPQLFNVLNGSMSLIGPRPHPVELDEEYGPQIIDYARRHRIKPGMTGWAQVNGHRGETSSREKMQERISHDLFYINNWSFWLDLKILFGTIFVVVAGQNAF